MRILIVDDRRDVGLLMTSLIAQGGHEACVATDGCMAVKLAGELPPQAVLLDIQMPGIDGYETARRRATAMVINFHLRGNRRSGRYPASQPKRFRRHLCQALQCQQARRLVSQLLKQRQ